MASTEKPLSRIEIGKKLRTGQAPWPVLDNEPVSIPGAEWSAYDILLSQCLDMANLTGKVGWTKRVNGNSFIYEVFPKSLKDGQPGAPVLVEDLNKAITETFDNARVEQQDGQVEITIPLGKPKQSTE